MLAVKMTSRPNLHLYTAQTPNGIKISITLEELGLPYKVTKLSFDKKEQKQPWFLEINPNGRIPALTDTFDDGETIHIFESGSIQQYLIEQYDKDHKISYPKGTREYYEMNNWLFFLNAGLGPMQGQAHHFNRYAPEQVPYGITRYTNETKRLYGVLNTHLEKSKSGFLVGDKCTIADIAHWGWVTMGFWGKVDIDEFPALKAWDERMLARPAVEKGRHVPERQALRELRNDPEKLDEHAAKNAKWIQEGLAHDLKK